MPSVKVARSCIASVCDHLRVLPKLLPAVTADRDFQVCDRMWWFGFARCLQISSADEFYPFREDFMGTLMPAYKAQFGERYTTTDVGYSLVFPFVPVNQTHKGRDSARHAQVQENPG